jgi:hypothetical protein
MFVFGALVGAGLTLCLAALAGPPRASTESDTEFL